MADHVANRSRILQDLREELVGPSPLGDTIDCAADIRFATRQEASLPRRQSVTGEEILLRDPPTKRYGVGVLYPTRLPLDAESEDAAEGSESGTETSGAATYTLREAMPAQEPGVSDLLTEQAGTVGASVDPEGDDFDISATNTYRQSSMAISFLAEFPEGSSLVIDAAGGRYQRKKIVVEDKERIWWLRSPVTLSAQIAREEICTAGPSRIRPPRPQTADTDGPDIQIEVHSRPYETGRESARLLTVCLINRTLATASADEMSLFQSGLTVRVLAPDGLAHIPPYPKHSRDELDEDERSLDLLYRDMETYAVGHGCAADWSAPGAARRASEVRTESLPTCDTPSITPDVTRTDGSPVEVSMSALAGLVPGDDGYAAMDEVVSLYEDWIARQTEDARRLDATFQDAAQRHLILCRACAQRMREGLVYLRQNQRAHRAFALANHALLLQQIATARKPRSVEYDARARRLAFSTPYASPDASAVPDGRGRWRAFQIAFLLMAVRSTAEPEDDERQTVELIWFPTGGGKTEAYLGLTSFAMLLRRLTDPADAGVTCLMRYTLRLLTAQQFLRASGLVCAMEMLRRQHVGELGSEPFSIGIWLGGGMTPNTREQARQALRDLRKGAGNLFILDRCPWCGAQLGRLEHRRGRQKKADVPVVGYEAEGGTVVFRCPDGACAFHSGLPVYVVDDDIYDVRPSLVIGTVDKFAMLAWRPQARSLFGIADDGTRLCSPPSLIIQDELHMISGPLGSMVGLYEAAIEELCTDGDGGDGGRCPKVVCSTATIRRYEDQIMSLYGRERSALFPPPGLSAEDSFFARYARNADGSPCPGRLYVGVHAPGLGSLQTAQVRTLTSLLQSPMQLPDEERDPWWTLVVFFNSLRELGTTLSLLQSDIPDRLDSVRMRYGLGFAQLRRDPSVLELTGRISSDRVPEAISLLETGYGSSGRPPVDVCLASSVMEVGIDIDRLSLMAVIGQPKTTSQYIQVTGRVGRSWQERPGLVVTIYSASKPRDRSHFEKFRSYHERLYAQVEPTSVTPFSPPALDRALHAVMALYVRQQGAGDATERPFPLPSQLLQRLQTVLQRRIERVAPAELATFERVLKRRLSEWQRWERTRWDGTVHEGDVPLLREAGAYVSPELAAISWPTPRSMRNVDAECQAEITTLYLRSEDDDAEGPY